MSAFVACICNKMCIITIRSLLGTKSVQSRTQTNVFNELLPQSNHIKTTLMPLIEIQIEPTAIKIEMKSLFRLTTYAKKYADRRSSITYSLDIQN